MQREDLLRPTGRSLSHDVRQAVLISGFLFRLTAHRLMLDDKAALLHLGSVEDIVDELQEPLTRHLDRGDGEVCLEGEKQGRS